MHYTQQKSQVTSKTNSQQTVLYAALQGFIDGPMLRAELRSWDEQYGEVLPSALLLDLLNVSGYGPGAPTIAHNWLLKAQRRGVRRVAFVATSSVIRTIVRVVSPKVEIELACFGGEDAAIAWLEGRPAPELGPGKRKSAKKTEPPVQPRP